MNLAKLATRHAMHGIQTMQESNWALHAHAVDDMIAQLKSGIIVIFMVH